jgi:cohesin complex subunit SA-1/2
VVTSDDEGSEVEEPMGETPPAATPTRPKPRPTYRSALTTQEHDLVTESDDNIPEDVAESSTLTPKSRPRPKATYKGSISPSKESHIEVNGTSIPKISRKREREDEEDESATEEAGSPARQGTPPSDIQVRRKRVRH